MVSRVESAARDGLTLDLLLTKEFFLCEAVFFSWATCNVVVEIIVAISNVTIFISVIPCSIELLLSLLPFKGSKLIIITLQKGKAFNILLLRKVRLDHA